MHTSFKTGFVLAALALLFACEKTIEFKGDNIEPKIVVNANLVAGQPLFVQLMKSRSLLSEKTVVDALFDATAELYEDGEWVETLDTLHLPYYTNKDEPLMYFAGYVGKTIPKAGKTYRLEVSSTGLETVSCETTVPPAVEISRLDTVTENFWYEGNSSPQPRLKITVHFADPQIVENYYRIKSELTSGREKNYYQQYPGQEHLPSDTIEVRYGTRHLIDLSDPVFKSDDQANEVIFGSPDNRFALFDDVLIDGKNYGLELFNYNQYPIYNRQENPESGNFDRQTISLISLSKEYYHYLHSVNYHHWYSDDFFSEPYPVLSNVKGGMGIFGSSNISKAHLLIGNYPMEGKVYVDAPQNGGYGY